MTKLHARYMYLFHWHCNYFHFLITAVARLYTCTCTLLHSMNTYKETENSSSWGTQFMYYFVSSICSYSKMMTSNLSWCHKINMSTSVCFMYSTWILVTQRKVITVLLQCKWKTQDYDPCAGRGRGRFFDTTVTRMCKGLFDSLTFKIWELRNSLG